MGKKIPKAWRESARKLRGIKEMMWVENKICSFGKVITCDGEKTSVVSLVGIKPYIPKILRGRAFGRGNPWWDQLDLIEFQYEEELRIKKEALC